VLRRARAGARHTMRPWPADWPAAVSRVSKTAAARRARANRWSASSAATTRPAGSANRCRRCGNCLMWASTWTVAADVAAGKVRRKGRTKLPSITVTARQPWPKPAKRPASICSLAGKNMPNRKLTASLHVDLRRAV